MDYIKVGKYINKLRKSKGYTQKDLASKLGITFQAVSKWELGETLPDVILLLDLAQILDTTVDKILNGGTLAIKERKFINIQDVVDGFDAILEAKRCFGENSLFYKGMIEGINNKMNMDIEVCLNDSKIREVLYTEVILQGIENGGYVDMSDVKNFFKNPKLIKYIEDYMNRI